MVESKLEAEAEAEASRLNRPTLGIPSHLDLVAVAYALTVSLLSPLHNVSPRSLLAFCCEARSRPVHALHDFRFP